MTTHNDLVCWRCGAAIAELPLPLARLAECPACHVYLHACKLCQFYNPNVAKQCTEQDAEEVVNKEWTNFCEYFKPRPKAFNEAVHAKGQAARSQLDALFGGGKASGEQPADEARQKLDALFGGKRKD